MITEEMVVDGNHDNHIEVYLVTMTYIYWLPVAIECFGRIRIRMVLIIGVLDHRLVAVLAMIVDYRRV